MDKPRSYGLRPSYVVSMPAATVTIFEYAANPATATYDNLKSSAKFRGEKLADSRLLTFALCCTQ